MTVARLAISFDPALAKQVRKAAGKQPTSAWLADAARRKLRAEGLLAVVEDWEAEHGLLEADAPALSPRGAKRSVRTRSAR